MKRIVSKKGCLFMFEERAHKWDEWLKDGVMCHLFKKGIGERKGITEGLCCLRWGTGC